MLKKHQDLSRAGSEQKFKGGLADTAEQTVRLHTAHHLLLKALQIVLGPEVHQRGSNITQERLRIDFNYPQKVTREQLTEVEKIVNEKIAEICPWYAPRWGKMKLKSSVLSTNLAQNIRTKYRFTQLVTLTRRSRLSFAAARTPKAPANLPKERSILKSKKRKPSHKEFAE